MANRFTNYRTAKFNPLSMQEILTPALAKQKQHDEQVANLQAVSALDSTRLGADEEAVKSELDRLKGGASELSTQILNEGISRSSKFAFNDLRTQVQKSQSLEGVLGKAKTAYDKRQANVKAVMANKNLSEQQKQHGLNKQLNEYAGISGPGYQDYVGASYVDVQEKAIDLAKNMEPTVIADTLGYEYDELTGTYKDGKYSRKELRPEEIAFAVNQALMGDESVASYLRDAQNIGIISDPKNYINNIAQNTGNIFKQFELKKESNFLPQHVSERLTQDGKYMVDETKYWNTHHISTVSEEQVSLNYTDTDDDTRWNPDGSLREFDDTLGFGAGTGTPGVGGAFAPGTTGGRLGGPNEEIVRQQKEYNIKKDNLNKFKKNLGWQNLSDREATVLKNEFDKDTNAYYSLVSKPMNLKNSFYNMKTIMLGEPGTVEIDGEKIQKTGDIKTRGIKVNGASGGITNYASIAREYWGGDEDKLAAALKAGSMLGISPSNPDMPMGMVFQFSDDNNNPITITVASDESDQQIYGDASKLSRAMREANTFSMEQDIDEDGKPLYKYYVLDAQTTPDPKTGKPTKPHWVPRLIQSYDMFDSKASLMASNPTEIYDMDTIVQQDLQEVAAKYNYAPTTSKGYK